ncbi:MAG: AIR synthase family protein [Candidatus Atabeyarchaeum deiterrae]
MTPPTSQPTKLSLGKVPGDILKRIVFKLTGATNPHVLSGPSIGQDAAVIEYQGKLLVAKSDPISGAENNVGWLAVHINANDIAVRGAKPLFYLSIIMLPENSDSSTLEEVCKGIDFAAKELDVSVVGGHTEVTSAVSRPVLCGTMIGEASRNKIILTSGAKIGDTIIVTKNVALEGTAIIASDRYNELRGALGDKLLRQSQWFKTRISVVKEALAAADTGFVNCMKDPTEGGLLQALNEIAEASKVGYSIDERLVPIEEETKRICENLQLDPLKLISSGMLVVTVPEQKEKRVIEKINGVGVKAAKIGTIKSKGRTARRLSGKTEKVEEFVTEELWRALKATARK